MRERWSIVVLFLTADIIPSGIPIKIAITTAPNAKNKRVRENPENLRQDLSACPEGGAEVSTQDTADISYVLHIEGLIQAKLLSQPFHDLRRRVIIARECLDGIAGRRMDDQKSEGDSPKNGWNDYQYSS